MHPMRVGRRAFLAAVGIAAVPSATRARQPATIGLVASLSRPGGNVTGATFIGISLTAKRLQLLHEIAPKATDLAILVNPNGTLAESQVTDAQAAMSAMGLRLHVLKAVSDAEID